MDKLNILIIQDEVIINTHLSKTLKSFGFRNIHIAKSSKEAILIASKVKIDLLLSDVKIEGDIDGIDTAHILQSLYGLPVIFITSYKDRDILIRVSKLDILGYLLKPYRVDELKALLELSIIKYNLLDYPTAIHYKNYTYNTKIKVLKKGTEIIFLSKKEKLFVSLLFSNIHKITLYDSIDKTVWYSDYVSENTRRTFIYRFKNKFPDFNLKVEKSVGIGIFN